MWLLVYCQDSKSHLIINRADIPDDEVDVGSVVDVVQNGEVVFMNPNRAICEGRCSALRKNPSLDKNGYLRSHLLQSETAKKDMIESKLDRIIRYLTNFEQRLQRLADRQQQLDRDLIALWTCIRPVTEPTGANESSSLTLTPPSLPRSKMDVCDRTMKLPIMSLETASTTTEKVEMILDYHRSLTMPKPQNPITYPYHISRDLVGVIHRTKRSATAFARAVERELFLNDIDRDVNLDKRADQGKVRWLRQLIREWYPSPTFSAEASLWSACQVAVNDYHRKRRNLSRMCRKNTSMGECSSHSKSPDESELQPPSKLARTEVESPTCVQAIHCEDYDDVKGVSATDLL